jgi:hypothetical protein
MHVKPVSIIRSNLVACLGFLAFDVLIDLYSRVLGSHLYVVATGSEILFSYFIYRAVLFGESFDFAGLLRASFLSQFGRFVWRLICLAVLLVLIGMIVVLPALVIGGHTQFRAPLAALSMVTLMFTVLPALLAWLGTWLPATVFGQATSLREASLRGRANFLAVFACLLIPTAIDSCASFLRGVGVLGRYLPVPMQFHYGVTGYLPLVVVVLSCVLKLSADVLFAVALSRAYLTAEQLSPAAISA